MNYEWKRFWSRPTDPFTLDTNGYLADPLAEWGHVFSPEVKQFDQIADVPCLVLLGEPGIGKSHVISHEYARHKLLIEATGDTALRVDLRSAGSDQRLEDMVFNSSNFQEWVAGTHRLHLYLDSLDECLLRVGVVATLLADDLPKYECERLSVRIACRTAVWPDHVLGAALRTIYGDDAYDSYELLPLRRIDVTSAAVANGLDAEQFLDAVSELGAAAFASRPITLGFLLRSYASNGALPSSRYDLYEQGCRMLCDENNVSRRDSRDIPRLTGAQRFAVASRIAAATVYTNRSAVFCGAISEFAPPDVLRLSDLTVGTEEAFGERIEVGEKAVCEVLDTGLFSSRGEQLLGWAHQTYAEFLAARYLLNHSVSVPQLNSIILHADGRVVPQLHETVAWLAGRTPELLEQLVVTEPEILLQTDVTDPFVRERLLTELLARYEVGRLSVGEIPPFEHLRKLNHPGIEAQLRTYIEDSNLHLASRKAAVEIAKACRVQQLQDVLLRVALSEAEHYYLRVQCVAALSQIADDSHKALLRTLLQSSPEQDEDDELRGFTLWALWPSQLGTADLLAALIQSNNPHLHGRYASFLCSNFADLIPPEDLPIALAWAAQQEHPSNPIHPFKKPIAAIVGLAWQHLERSDVLIALAATICQWMDRYQGSIPGLISDDGTILAQSDPIRWRSILVAMLDKVESSGGDPTTVARAWVLARAHPDVRWLIEQTAEASSLRHHVAYAKLIRYQLPRPDPEQFDAIYIASISSEALRKEYSYLLEPVALDSERAVIMRRDHLRDCEWREREAVRTQPSPGDPSAQALRHLTDFEAGNLEAWVRLNRYFLSHSNGFSDSDDFEADLTTCKGWVDAEEPIRFRILEAAIDYVLRATPDIGACVHANVIDHGAYAGYRALRLLASERPAALHSLPSAVWRMWAPLCIAFPTTNAGPGWLQHKELAAEAYRHSPDTVIETLVTQIDKQNGEHGHLFVLYTVDSFLDARIAGALANRLRDPTLTPQALKDILRRLLVRQDEEFRPHRLCGITFAEGLVRNFAERGTDRDKALAAAHSLMTQGQGGGWGVVWAVIQQDSDFGRELIDLVSSGARDASSTLEPLAEKDLADLFLWLIHEYPTEDVSSDAGSAVHWRSDVLRAIQFRGTEAAIHAMQRIANIHPELVWIPMIIRETQASIRRITWQPLTPRDIVRLAHDAKARVVQDGDHLLTLVLESLGRFERELHGETPLVSSLWYPIKGASAPAVVYRPQDESHLSDQIRRHLVRDLSDLPVVVNREVQIRPRRGDQPGENTDIHVDAVIMDANHHVIDTVSVIVETKCCWNRELETAMQTQLVDRYMKDNACRHGLYVVGWFNCDSWDTKDKRKNQAPELTIDAARAKFAAQAASLTGGGTRIASYVIDTALR